MTALKWTAAALVAMLAFPAYADVSGPACVGQWATMRADEMMDMGIEDKASICPNAQADRVV